MHIDFTSISKQTILMKKYLLYLTVASILFNSCKNSDLEVIDQDASTTESNYYTEKHRPQFHFSPESNWMNDPNGMVYYEGEYHLFYQYYPDSTVWGPMHWGHAISRDLVHWEHLPIALYPDKHGLIFSGSAVVDWKNTTGFGNGTNAPLVAIFSYHDMEKERAGIEDDFQTQGIAYSNDKGRTWIKYEGNPVIGNPGIRDFRDPKVIWHKETNKWIMAVAALDHLKFYGSPDLKEWKFLSDFGKNIGSHDGVWECPDLFKLTADNGKEYWVLIENMNPGNPNGGSGTQYFIGQFDGEKFSVDPAFMKLLGNIPEFIPEGVLFEDFESDYGQWTVEGIAFGASPVSGKLNAQQALSGFSGHKLANSFYTGDKAIGSLTSDEFTILNNAINFQIGGGNHRGRTYIALEVEGKRVREAEGKNQERLEWRGWDVSGYIGKKARIKIVDNYTGEWGRINIDQIMFADEIAYAEKTGSVWLDSGMDNYAGVTWSDVPESDGRRIFLGWMSNWAYAQIVPTEKWRSAMTIPWELNIKMIGGIPRLIGVPVVELERLRLNPIQFEYGSFKIPSGLAEINTSFSSTEDFSFVLSNQLNEQVSFHFNASENLFSFDKTKVGGANFSEDFAGIHTAHRIKNEERITLKALIDHSSIELFLDGGANIFTEIFFPTKLYTDIRLSGKTEVVNAFELSRIWD